MIEDEYREVAAAVTTWFLDTFATPFVAWLGNNAKEQVHQKWTEYKVWPQKERTFDFEREISSKQVRKLNTFFEANELLVQCLKLAVVSDRHLVMRDLLQPPDVTSGG